VGLDGRLGERVAERMGDISCIERDVEAGGRVGVRGGKLCAEFYRAYE
jgi:hypothetical protein